MGEITLKELGRGRSKWYRPNFPDGHDVCVAKPIKAVKEFIRARTFLNVHDDRAICAIYPKYVERVGGKWCSTFNVCNQHEVDDTEFRIWPPHGFKVTPNSRVVDSGILKVFSLWKRYK